MELFLAFLLAVRIASPPGAERYRQPQMAVRDNRIAMVFGAGRTVYFAQSRDGGRTFSDPAKVAEAESLALGRHRGPRVAFSKDGIVVSAIRHTPGDLIVWRSGDSGRTWKQAGIINDVPGAAREGLHAMAAAPDGPLFAAWLDLRAKGTRLYGSRSTNGGATWSPNVLIYESPDGTICECCHPSVAIGGNGEIWVMWRNVVAGSRDLYLAHSRDGVKFSNAEKLGQGTWELNACPMDGGGLGAANGRVATAWRRASEVFLAEPGRPETAIAKGKDAALALGRGGPYLAWTAGTAIQVRSRKQPDPRTLAEKGGFASVVALPGGGALVAWEDDAGIAIERID